MVEETEIWKTYVKYVNQYNCKIRTHIDVSNFGNVIIHKYNFEKNVSITFDKRGHRCIGAYPIYRIIYELFVGPIPKGYCIHHKDFNPTNDRVDNLQLMTIREHIKLHAQKRGWTKSDKWIDKHKERMKDVKWWNNGITNKLCVSSPGDEWKRGKIKKGTN